MDPKYLNEMRNSALKLDFVFEVQDTKNQNLIFNAEFLISLRYFRIIDPSAFIIQQNLIFPLFASASIKAINFLSQNYLFH